MSSHIVLPINETHVEPILNRRDEIVSKVESILPHSKVEKGLCGFNEKLAQLRQLIHDCKLLNAELREMSSLEHIFLGIGDVMRKENISVEYPREESLVPAAKSSCLKTETECVVPNNVAPERPETSASEAKTATTYILTPICHEEFEEIPKYMRGRMSVVEINEIISKFNEFLTEKRRLLNAPFKKLPMKDKDQVAKWKEQETADIAGKLFCQEIDLKPMLSDRAKTLFRSAIPCLRHVHRIKEVRVKGKVYFLPY